jgi:hypothetical protein
MMNQQDTEVTDTATGSAGLYEPYSALPAPNFEDLFLTFAGAYSAVVFVNGEWVPVEFFGNISWVYRGYSE